MKTIQIELQFLLTLYRFRASVVIMALSHDIRKVIFMGFVNISFPSHFESIDIDFKMDNFLSELYTVKNQVIKLMGSVVT